MCPALNSIETSTAKITLVEEDILRLEFRPNCFVDLAEFEENLAAYKKLIGDRKVYVLTIAPEGSNISAEGRNKFASKERSSFKLAEGFVISSLAHKIMANFISRMQRPAHPLRFFSKEEDALKWLRKIKAGKG
jgi:hypothetical protein